MERVRQLLALGASVTAQDEQGRTALIAAAYQNNLSGTDLLIPR
jgi:ankyrin repeat protein